MLTGATRVTTLMACAGVMASIFGCAAGGSHVRKLPPQAPRTLNNFVAELVRIENVDGSGVREVAFRNPREGWICVRASGRPDRDGHIAVSLIGDGAEGSADVLVIRAGQTETAEAMRYLPPGDYRARITFTRAVLDAFSLRSIPAIIFANHPYPPHLPRFGRYDWTQLKSMGILDSCNVIITGPRGFYAMREWLANGKQVLQQAGVPGVGVTLDEPISPESVYRYWVTSPGMNHPGMSGVIADEFYASLEKRYPAYLPAIRRIRLARPDRVFYPYIAGSPKSLRGFVEGLKDTHCRFAWERYLAEKPTEDEARAFIDRSLKRQMLGFEEYFPGFSSRCIVVLGFLCGPNESLNLDPSVNFKVFTDMQLHLLATDEVFDDLYGVEMYLSAYCDEEYMRWCGKLFRHYCIEGSTERLTNDPYKLDHVINPDFEEGLDGWTVEAAEEGSVTTERMEDFGWLQGRYPDRTKGNSFLLMRRCAERPNVVSQTIRNLTPGRFYSVKMYSANYDDLTKGDILRVSLRVQGAELVPEENIRGLYHNCYSHRSKKFGNARTWFNFHRVVFRAIAPTATLVISDWPDRKRSSGPIGQRTAVNFIEVEPYLMPEAFGK